MDQSQLEGLVKDINARTTRIEQKLPELATKSDVRKQVKEEGERTRQNFNAVAERIEASVAVIAEHERRITKLEADSLKRR